MSLSPKELDRNSHSAAELRQASLHENSTSGDYLAYKNKGTTEEYISRNQADSGRKSAAPEQHPDAERGHRDDESERRPLRKAASRQCSSEVLATHSESENGQNGQNGQNDRTMVRSSSGRSQNPRSKSNRKPAHGRSQSHTKIHTRLSTSVGGHKPELSRSKSTDGIVPKRPAVKRNNRSFTKLSLLQPLTKTVLNSSINRAIGALQPLTKTISRDSIKLYALRKTMLNGLAKGADSTHLLRSNKSANSLRSMNQTKNANRSSTSLKGLKDTAAVGLKTSTKKEKAILKLNEDDQYNEFEDMSENSENDDDYEADEADAEAEAEVEAEADDANGAELQKVDSEEQIQESAQRKFEVELPSDIEEVAEKNASTESVNAKETTETPHLVKVETFDLPALYTDVPTKKNHRNDSVLDHSLDLNKNAILPQPLEKQHHKNEHELSERGSATKGAETGGEFKGAKIAPVSPQFSAPGSGPQNTTTNARRSFKEDTKEEPNVEIDDIAGNEGNESADTTSNNLYGGSFLLSQSTGMTRKIDATNPMVGFGQPGDNGESETFVQAKNGTDYEARPSVDMGVETLPRTPVAPVAQSSYQPNQTIFSNLQRNDSKYVSDVKQKRQGKSENGSRPVTPVAPLLQDAKKDFSSYLNQAGGSANNIETRTQQRLWLQRENSLLDVSANMDLSQVANLSNLSLNKLMFAHNYNTSGTSSRDNPAAMANWIQNSLQNPDSPTGSEVQLSSSNEGNATNAANMLYLIQSGQQNSIQSRTEFERLNREYVNVRRHLNPVAESLNRVEKHVGKSEIELPKSLKKNDKKGPYTATSNANSFKEYAPSWEKKEGEAILMLNKIWQDALILSSSLALSQKLLQEQQQNHLQSQRRGEYANQSSTQDFGTNQMKHQRRSMGGLGSSVGRALAPTTRAVKLAQGDR